MEIVIYIYKKGGLVIGKESENVGYSVGKIIRQADLLSDYEFRNGSITDISRLNAEKKAGKNLNAKIKNCPLCNSRRCNGSNHSSVSRATKAGVSGATTAGNLGMAVAGWWITRTSPLGIVIGFFTSFAPGYLDDAKDQYIEYNNELENVRNKTGG